MIRYTHHPPQDVPEDLVNLGFVPADKIGELRASGLTVAIGKMLKLASQVEATWRLHGGYMLKLASQVRLHGAVTSRLHRGYIAVTSRLHRGYMAQIGFSGRRAEGGDAADGRREQGEVRCRPRRV